MHESTWTIFRPLEYSVIVAKDDRCWEDGLPFERMASHLNIPPKLERLQQCTMEAKQEVTKIWSSIGDIITKIDGTPVTLYSSEELIEAMNKTKGGFLLHLQKASKGASCDKDRIEELEDEVTELQNEILVREYDDTDKDEILHLTEKIMVLEKENNELRSVIDQYRQAEEEEERTHNRNRTREDDDNAANEDSTEDGTETGNGTREDGVGSGDESPADERGTAELGKTTLTLKEAKKIKYKEALKTISVHETFDRWYGLGNFVNIPAAGGLAAVVEKHGWAWCGRSTAQIRRMKQVAEAVKFHMDMIKKCLHNYATDNSTNLGIGHIQQRLDDAGLLNLDNEDDDVVVELIRRLSIINGQDEDSSGDGSDE